MNKETNFPKLICDLHNLKLSNNDTTHYYLDTTLKNEDHHTVENMTRVQYSG